VPDAFDDLAVHGQSPVEVKDQVRQVKPPLAGDFTLQHPLAPDQFTGSKKATHRVLQRNIVELVRTTVTFQSRSCFVK
jgi:hypothetical protein